MTLDPLVGLIFFVIIIGTSVTILVVARQLLLWYFRINQMADNIAYIADYLRRREYRENTNRSIEKTKIEL